MVSPYTQPGVFFRHDASALCLILDYDGTLVPLAATPELAAPDPALLTLLRELAARARVHVVSGRSRDDLQRWLGDLPIGLHAEHGHWSRGAERGEWAAVAPVRAAWKEALRPILAAFVDRVPGAFLEEKATTLGVHYRASDPALVAARLPELEAALRGPMEAHALALMAGARVVEVRSRGVHKGLVVAGILAELPRGATIIAIGDDRTDEDLFAALPKEAPAIHVGPGSSIASYRLPDPAAVRRFLSTFLDQRAMGRPPS